MRLPTPLLRRNPNVHKNTFGHVLVLAGSKRMLGAAALTSLACMRSGAGLVTLGIPESLNTTVQKKISHVVMTLPLKDTKEQSLSFQAFDQIKKSYSQFDAIAIGPGLSTYPATQQLVRKIIATSPKPLIIDAYGLIALVGNLALLTKTQTPKILTPHPGEMARLIKSDKNKIENNRKIIARQFAKQYHCILLLKGHRTIVASLDGKIYLNTTGNSGMATAGSGDVLTGMIAGFMAQGLSAFDAAQYGAYLHGLAGDLAAKTKTKLSMIATDIIDYIPKAIKKI